MRHTLGRRWVYAALLAALAAAPAVVAQDDRGRQPGERKVEPIDLPLDKPGVWTLNFRYKPPRIMTVDGFDKAGKPTKQTVWYMWYQVYNRSGEPVYFTPEFELVTKDQDGPLGKFLDGAQPSVVDAIRKIEDPTGALNIQTSVSISKNKIPLTPPDLPFPTVRSTYGLAVWLDVPEKAANANNFSIYVYGLSNGLTVKGTRADPQMVISRKALQLDFRRPTDAVRNKAFDIRVFENNGLGAEKWQYIAGPPKKNDPPKN